MSRGPANLAWLRSPTLPRARSFEAEIVVRAAGGGDNSKAPGKWGVTIDGENNNDGQSGHTFIFEPADGGKVAVRQLDPTVLAAIAEQTRADIIVLGGFRLQCFEGGNGALTALHAAIATRIEPIDIAQMRHLVPGRDYLFVVFDDGGFARVPMTSLP